MDARWWPIYCALGVFAVAANNWATYSLASAANESIEKSLAPPASDEQAHFLDEFSTWGDLMFWYGIVLLIVGILLIVNSRSLTDNPWHQASDQWVFAVFVMMLNIVLYRHNCGVTAPRIRGGLHRTVERLRRLARIESMRAVG